MYESNNSSTAVIWIVLILLCTGIVVALFWAFPTYHVWQQEMSGKARLAEAEWSRQIKVEEAKANLESEKLNAESEVVRAEGAARSIEIEGGALTENYIKYLWIRQLNTGEKQLIYVPTEAGLPILEATRLQPQE